LTLSPLNRAPDLITEARGIYLTAFNWNSNRLKKAGHHLGGDSVLSLLASKAPSDSTGWPHL